MAPSVGPIQPPRTSVTTRDDPAATLQPAAAPDTFVSGASDAPPPAPLLAPSLLVRSPNGKPPPKSVLIFAAGGNAPGQNAFLKPFVLNLIRQGIKVLVAEGGAAALANSADCIREMTLEEAEAIDEREGSIVIGTTRSKKEAVDAMAENIRASGAEMTVVIGGDGGLTLAKVLQEKGIDTIGVPKSMDGNIGVRVRGGKERLHSIGHSTSVNRASEYVQLLKRKAAKDHKVYILEVNGRNTGWLARAAGMQSVTPVFIGEHPSLLSALDKAAEEMRETGGVIIVAESVEFLDQDRRLIDLHTIVENPLPQDPLFILENLLTAQGIPARQIALTPLLPNDLERSAEAARNQIRKMILSAQTQGRLNLVQISDATWAHMEQMPQTLFLRTLPSGPLHQTLLSWEKALHSGDLSVIVVSDRLSLRDIPPQQGETDGRTRYQTRRVGEHVAFHLRERLGIDAVPFTVTHLLMAETTSEIEVPQGEILAHIVANAVVRREAGKVVGMTADSAKPISAPLDAIFDMEAIDPTLPSPQKTIHQSVVQICEAFAKGLRHMVLVDNQLSFHPHSMAAIDSIPKEKKGMPILYRMSLINKGSERFLAIFPISSQTPFIRFPLPQLSTIEWEILSRHFRGDELPLVNVRHPDSLALMALLLEEGTPAFPDHDSFTAWTDHFLETCPDEVIPHALLEDALADIDPARRFGYVSDLMALVLGGFGETAVRKMGDTGPGFHAQEIPALLRRKAKELRDEFAETPPDWWDVPHVFQMAVTASDQQAIAYLVEDGLMALGCPEGEREETADFLRPLLLGLWQEADSAQSETAFTWSRLFLQGLTTDPVCAGRAAKLLAITNAIEKGEPLPEHKPSSPIDLLFHAFRPDLESCGFTPADLARMVQHVPTDKWDATLRKFGFLVRSGLPDQLKKETGSHEYLLLLMELVPSDELRSLLGSLQSVGYLNAAGPFIRAMGNPPKGSPFMTALDVCRDEAWKIYEDPTRGDALQRGRQALDMPYDEHLNMTLFKAWLSTQPYEESFDYETVEGAFKILAPIL
ncbi:MAG: 6-phosphofructokinase, partial [Deltaproteobacteria bacterium]|nr:6-phosphofructokinase [Deltaproteobacteria bacterium]